MRIGVRALTDKIDKIAESCTRPDRYPMSLYKCHVDEIRDDVLARLSDSASTTDPILKEQYYLFSWLAVYLLNDQVEKFALVGVSERDSSWNHLNLVIDDLVNRLRLSSRPLPFLGASFYCTGSFVYAQQGIPVPVSPFYQVSAESHDSTLFWPLLAHEIAHLKLSESSEMAEIRRELTRQNLRDEKYSERLDEALCDVIATLLYGPAYAASFGTKFWQLPDERTDDGYPSNQYRLFVMMKVLEEKHTGSSICPILENTYQINEKEARRERISILTDEMLALGDVLVRNPTDISDSKIASFSTDISSINYGRLDYMFNTFWSMIYEGTMTFDAASNAANCLLERWAKGSKSSTQIGS
jgi:hypothetical protein